MIARVAKEYTFEASHRLDNHSGKCRNLHGHSYRVVVCLRGRVNEHEGSPSEGMAIDYGDMDKVIEPIIAELDHLHLNSIIAVPTAENIAGWLSVRLLETWPVFSAMLPPNAATGETIPMLAFVRVYETAKTYAEVNTEW